jgi:iron complex outermembrane recepter protein
MGRPHLHTLAVLSTAGVLGVSTPAMSQNETQVGEDLNGSDIIVTARRVEERLQDVPISITVYSQQDISKRNIVIASDLAAYTPALSSNQQYGPDKASFAIRGFNQDSNTAPTVGVYFDDVVGVRAQGGTTSGSTAPAGSFTDLQNIQVLKGPQGTLFGRNTTGGAILLVPTKPTDNLEGYVEGSIGNYDLRRGQAVLNVPLSDTFRVRMSIDRNKRDGYIKNHASDGPSRFNNTDYTYARLSIVGDLTPDLENYTVAYYSKSRTAGFAGKISYCDRNPIDFTDPTGVKTPGSPTFSFTRAVFAVAACNQMDRQAARGDGRLDVEVRAPDGHVRIENWQIINTTTWTASDNLTVKNIASYGEFREHASTSIGSSNFFTPAMPFPLTATTAASVGQPLDPFILDVYPGFDQAAQSTFTEELQLQGQSGDGKLNYVVGGYLEFSRPQGWSAGRTGIFASCNSAALTCNTPLGFAIISQSMTKLAFDNHGVFAQGTYQFNDKLSFTAGMRWTFDKIVGMADSTRYTFAPIPGLGNQIVAWNCNDNLRNKNPDGSAINLAARTFGGDGSGDITKCRTRLVNSSNAPTWVVDLDYKITPDAMVYAKWSRGYRQGGMTFTNPGLEMWEPEHLNTYEIGAKFSFEGAVPGYFNLAGHYSKITDQQVITASVPKPGSGLSGGNVVANAGKATVYGVEVDGAATLFEHLRLNVGYAYLHTRIDEFVPPALSSDSPFASLENTTDVGLPFTLSPRHRLTATATVMLPIDETLGDLSAGATWTYTSRQNANFASTIGQLPATNLLNLNLDWNRVAGSPIDLSIFATNVTNRIYPVNTLGGNATVGYDSLLYGQPRMVGGRLRFNFGR